jgi:hypothetical protein
MNDMNPLGEALGAMLMLLGPLVAGCIWIVCSNLLRERREKKRREAQELKRLRALCARLQAENQRLIERLSA